MTKIEKFQLNGQHYSITQIINLIELIDYLDYDSSLLILEYNNVVCNKKNWKNILIKNDDKIEVVTIVGGG